MALSTVKGNRKMSQVFQYSVLQDFFCVLHCYRKGYVWMCLCGWQAAPVEEWGSRCFPTAWATPGFDLDNRLKMQAFVVTWQLSRVWSWKH